jgi:hypothetical protein
MNTPNKEPIQLPGLAQEYDLFMGISELFNEETDSLPALGGKTIQASGIDRTLRVLKAFGGCRFEQIKGSYCQACLKRFVSRKPNKAGYPVLHVPARECSVWGWCYFRAVEAVMIKNPRQAAKLGVIKNPEQVRMWLDD